MTLKGREMVYNGFESGISPLPNQSIVLAKPEKSSSSEKSSSLEHSNNYYEYNSPETEISGGELTLLTPKQMLQKLSIALAQVQTGNTTENLLNEIC